MRRRAAVALMLASTVATAVAAGPEKDACTPTAITADEAALDRTLRDPLTRYPWLVQAVPICSVLSNGTPSEQFATFSTCLAKACVDGQATGCQEASRSIIATVRANAAARARSARQRQQCRPAVVDAAARTPLETYFESQLALERGDVETVRRLSVSADADSVYAIQVAKSVPAFYRVAAARQGDDVAELARFVRAANTPRGDFDPSEYKEEQSGAYATVTRGNSPYPSYFRRVAGEWKSDLARQKANNPNASAGPAIAQLYSFAWQTAADVVNGGRGFAPVVAGAADQCITLGLFIVTVDVERAKENCTELMDKRFGAAETSAPSPPAPRPSPAAPASPAVGTSSTEGLPKDIAPIDTAIDRGFIVWERSWFTDRYLRSSAHVAQGQCQANACRVSGRFSFSRGGVEYPATFRASLSTDGASTYSVTQLCYQDPSTGLSDCMR